MKSFGIIYKATNLINGKCYIGQTTQKLKRRKCIHKSDSYKNNNYFHNAIHKYGIENFKWEILYECSSRTVLNEMETLMIIEHISFWKFGKGYNLTWGGDGINGFKHSEETKGKISEALKGNKYSLGYKPSEEHKRKISEKLKGRIFSEETKKKISVSKKNMSKETKRKISESHKGNKNHFYGKHHSEETKKKISESNKKEQ